MAFGFLDFFKKDKDEEAEDRPSQESAPHEEAPPEEAPPPQPEPAAAEPAPHYDEPETPDLEQQDPVSESSFDDLASLLDDEEDEVEADDVLGLDDEPEDEPAPQMAQPPADTIYVPADKIMPDLPDEVLVAPADQLIAEYKGQQDFIFSFNRSDLMYSLSRGKLEMSVSDLAAKIPIDVFSDNLAQVGDQVINLPLAQVVPLIPPEWMQRADQDDSKVKLIDDVQDFFKDLGTPAPAEAEVEDEPEDEAAYSADESATMVDQRPAMEQEPEPELEDEEEYTDAVEDDLPTQAYMDQSEPEPIEEELTYAYDEYDDEPVAEQDADDEQEAEEEYEQPASEPHIELGIQQPYEPESVAAEEEELEEVEEEETQGLAAPRRAEQEERYPPVEAPPPSPQEFEDELPDVEEPDVEEPEPVEEPPTLQRPIAEEPEVEEPEPVEEPEAETVVPPAPTAPEPPVVQPPAPAVQEPAARQPDPVEQPSVQEPPSIQPPEPEPALSEKEAALIEAESDLASISSFDAVDPKQLTEKVFGEKRNKLELHTKHAGKPSEPEEKPWRSNNPNGVNINHEDVDKLSMLTGVGQHIAQLIVDYRQEHGPYRSLHDLLNIDGVGRHTFRSMTGISHRSGLRESELEINNVLNIDSETVSLPQIARQSLDKLQLQGIFLTSEDGFVLTSASKNEEVGKLEDIFAGIAPQLFKRCRRHIAQGRLPDIDMMTSYIGRYAVTFAGSEDVLITCVHKQPHPSTRDLRMLRKVGRELVWYFSVRAII